VTDCNFIFSDTKCSEIYSICVTTDHNHLVSPDVLMELSVSVGVLGMALRPHCLTEVGLGALLSRLP